MKPARVVYRGITGSKADHFGLAAFGFALADVEILERAVREDLPQSIYDEYSHLLEHAIYQDIREVLWPKRWECVKRRYLKWRRLPVGTEAWVDALCRLHGTLCGNLVLVAGAYYEQEEMGVKT